VRCEGGGGREAPCTVGDDGTEDGRGERERGDAAPRMSSTSRGGALDVRTPGAGRVVMARGASVVAGVGSATAAVSESGDAMTIPGEGGSGRRGYTRAWPGR